MVLPGLDTDLDDATWELIGEAKDGGRVVHPPAFGHPQLAMHGLLRRIGIARSEVTALGASGARERLTSEALRPPEATEHWAQRIDATARDAALAAITVIEGANAEDEALAIAVALREAVHENKTAALVTPDRALARRVAAALVALEHRGGRLRRRRAARHRGRRVRAACGAGRARRAGAGHAAGARSSMRASGSARPQVGIIARSPRWNWRCCAGRARAAARAVSRTRS